MALPSKPMPSAKALSSSAGAIATDLRTPRTSVNHSRTKRMSRSSIARSTYSCCLSIGGVLSSARVLRRHYNQRAVLVVPPALRRGAGGAAGSVPGGGAAGSVPGGSAPDVGAGDLGVVLGREQVGVLAGLHPQQPSLSERVGVADRGVVERGLVDLDDGAGDRGEQVGDRLGGLHLPTGPPRGQLRPDLGQVEVDDVPEGFGGHGGDPDGHRADPLVDPLVVGGVLQLRTDRCHGYSLLFGRR